MRTNSRGLGILLPDCRKERDASRSKHMPEAFESRPFGMHVDRDPFVADPEVMVAAVNNRRCTESDQPFGDGSRLVVHTRVRERVFAGRRR